MASWILNAFCLLIATSIASPTPQWQPWKPTSASLPTEASQDTAVAYGQYLELSGFASNVSHALLDWQTYRAPQACTQENVAIRKEWGSLSDQERIEYTDAVLCLQKKAPNTPADLAAGAKSRYDDWVTTHINQTETIHYTGNFLSWHRYFTWAYEQALRNECGYKGYQPYWDWSLTAANGLVNSPIFDGSATSMSGNGMFVPNRPDNLTRAGPGFKATKLPLGTGGGCITSGPFVNMSVNLGPVALAVPDGSTLTPPPGESKFRYNPRCLRRDLGETINQRYANATSVVRTILRGDIYDFEIDMQGEPVTGDLGVHGGGHWTIGGDPGDDLHVSPGDPMFFLHHAMIDKTWWTWQMLNPGLRQYSEQGAVSGTETYLNIPPSANQTLETIIQLGYIAKDGFAEPLKIKDLTSTIQGPFCYLYE